MAGTLTVNSSLLFWPNVKSEERYAPTYRQLNSETQNLAFKERLLGSVPIFQEMYFAGDSYTGTALSLRQ